MSLMAFFASAAQAEVGAQWLVLEKPGVLLTEAQILAKNTKFEVLELENSTGALLSEIGSTKIDISCTNLSLIDALLGGNGGVNNGASIKFTGCAFFSGGANGLEHIQSKCEVGTIETLPAHALLRLHQLADGVKDDTLLILPDNVEVRVTTVKLGPSCAFGEELPIFGNLALQDCGGTTKALEHLLSHLVNEFTALSTLALFGQRGKPGAKLASIDGSATVKLNTDALWSGDPS